jgi:PPM family protein phosphatase
VQQADYTQVKSSQIEWQVGALSETGPVRRENQDRMHRKRLGLGEVYIVADGMGGHKGGALAAQLTIEGLCHYLGKASRSDGIGPGLRQAFERTNQSVYEKSHSGDPEMRGMGSTAVLLLISGRTAHVAHVGDSRAYLYRRGRLRRLTADHTRAQKMIDAGILTPTDAQDHPSASVLERAIGTKPVIEMDMTKVSRLKRGDAFLLCTDGLSGYASDSDIDGVLRKTPTTKEIPKRLFDLALEKKSKDNVTIQFLQYGKREEARFSRTRLLYRTAAAAIGVALLFGLFQAYDVFLRNRTAQLVEALEEAKHEYQEANKKVRALEQQFSSLKTQLADAEQKKQGLEQDMPQLNEQLETIKKERDAAIRERQSADDKLQDIEKKLGKARREPAGS